MNLKKRKHVTPKKEHNFLMSLFLPYCFSYQTRKDLVLVKFYCNAAVLRFLKTFIKFAGKRLWWRTFLGKFKLFKMVSGKGVFLSVFRTPFYVCFQTLNRNTFLWLIALFGANTPESSNNGSFSLLNAPKFLGARFFILSKCKLYVFSEMYSFQKNRWNLKVSL